MLARIRKSVFRDLISITGARHDLFVFLKCWPPLYYNIHKGGISKQNLHTPQVLRRLVFHFPVMTLPTLPINRSVNDHSFYWYVQTTNIEIFSGFINAFSSRFRVKDNPLDQHGRLSRSQRSTWTGMVLCILWNFVSIQSNS